MTHGTVLVKYSFRYGVSASLLVMAMVACGGPTRADSSMRTVATKVAEFREDFSVGGLDLNPDGSQLAVNAMVAGDDVHVWALRGRPHILRTLRKPGPAGAGNVLRYSRDGLLLAAGHAGSGLVDKPSAIRVFDTKTGAVVHDPFEPPLGAGVVAAEFSPDGSVLVCALTRGPQQGDVLALHSTGSWERLGGLLTYPFSPQALALSPDGHFAAVGGTNYERSPPTHPQIVIVDLRTRQVLRTIDQAFPENNEVRSLAWSPDGASLAAGALVGNGPPNPGPTAVKVFDPSTGAELVRETAEKYAKIDGLRYSPDGKYLIEGTIDHHVRIWDSQHKVLLQKIPTDGQFLSISADSRYLAIAHYNDVSIWELK